ncbi:hypothetical protein [Cellulomonas gilvus]|uniref:Uncharacterized protein n=1 Tax=Cellulomonas gilvus (strain ATCC 13127 / NRRL B-14078) TaxID=593907 RepID=F8A0J1_CELGA|nr:hypothetical protein [Cellulomonas gilvus]AEI12676.1 hypothetical protein Celgi_2176 [Cellulomonas gilvus ATCC 13127]
MSDARGGYRSYTADGSWWTVRTYGSTYWVARVRHAEGGGYEVVQWFEAYAKAGWAAGAAAQLAYAQGVADAKAQVVRALHGALDEVGLGVPEPPVPVSRTPASQAPAELVLEADADLEPPN